MDFKRSRIEATDTYSFTKDEIESARSVINKNINEFMEIDQINGLSIELGRGRRFTKDLEEETVYTLTIGYCMTKRA